MTRFPPGAPVVADYLKGEENARQFYAGWWADPASFDAKAVEVDSRFGRAERKRAADALRAHDEVGGARLARFVEEGGYVVTTGQQPGLFTGPLYSVYKGLTAIALAARLEARLGRPVLPVFWVASEDHDWAEVNHTFALGADNELHRFEVPDPGGASNRPIHRIELLDQMPAVIDAFAQVFPDTDRRNAAVALLREAYSEPALLDTGFRALISQLLGPLGLFTTDASDPVVKEVSGSLLTAAVVEGPAHERVLTDTAARLAAAGYDTQVAVLPGGCNVFMEGSEGRERLYRTDDGVRFHTSGRIVPVDEILERASADAALLSPNVLLRPLVESMVFPTLSYVGGPGEMAYFAQLGDYFRSQGVLMPVVYPRVSMTIVEAKVAKVLQKFDMDAERLNRPFHELASDFARDELPGSVGEALGQLRGAIGKGAGALEAAAKGIDPTLKGPVQTARNAAFSAFADAEKKILQSVKRQSEIALGQLEKAQINLFPGGSPQERTLNIFQYLVRYGDDLIPTLAERVGHQVRMMDEQESVSTGE